MSQQRTEVPLGETPLVTIVAERPDPAPPGMAETQWAALVAQKREEKRGFAQLSHNSKVVVDSKSGHSVHLEDPDTVVDAIRDVRNAARKHGRIAE